MTDRVTVGNLRVAQSLYDFVNNEALPGTDIDPDTFWSGVDKVVADLTPKNQDLLARAAAQAGAWLGFHATTGLIALVTAILGAIAGANLVLILLDMMWARSARDRVATGTAAGTRSTDIELEASTGAGRR